MSDRRWDTREGPPPGFEAEWNARLARCPHANFTMDLACLAWDAAQGRHALAALVEADGRRAALVLRRAGRGFICGQPWRWQAVVEGAPVDRPIGLGAEDAVWVVEQARLLVAPAPVRVHLPVEPAAGTPGYESYATILQSITHDDDTILKAMHPAKRRMIRRAEREGYTVTETHDVETLRAFSRLLVDTATQRGKTPEFDPDVTPEPGQGWREWEQPWMWLLLAHREGQVASGLGDGVMKGGMVDGRKAASSAQARKDGAFAMLSFEEVRRSRDRGHRWINLGGDTLFKREISGTLGQRIPMYTWLTGGAAWGLKHHAEALYRRARRGAERVARRVRDRQRAAGGSKS